VNKYGSGTIVEPAEVDDSKRGDDISESENTENSNESRKKSKSGTHEDSSRSTSDSESSSQEDDYTIDDKHDIAPKPGDKDDKRVYKEAVDKVYDELEDRMDSDSHRINEDNMNERKLHKEVQDITPDDAHSEHTQELGYAISDRAENDGYISSAENRSGDFNDVSRSE
jgi:hypothetical protein